MNIWVTSDTHFNHTNICGPSISSWDSGYRDFSDLASMNECMLANINAVVKEDDVLYHLGDFAFGDKSKIPALRERIRCKTIHLVEGNHDTPVLKKRRELFDGFQSVKKYRELRIGKKLVCMFHYPVASWNEIGRGSVHLFAHCHGNKPGVGRSKDIGMDTNFFHPYHMEDVVHVLMQKEIVVVDHHTKKTNYG